MKKEIYEKIIGDVESYKDNIYLVCCIGVEFDYDIVSHFIKYYKELGVDKFLLILNTVDKNSEKLKYVQNILRKYNIKEEMVWIGDFRDEIKTHNMAQVVSKNTNLEDWVVTVDVDEFQKYYVDLRKFISYCEKKNYHCVMGNFVDRLTKNGKIVDINEDTNIWEVFPIETNMNYWNDTIYTKVLLSKAYAEVSKGHHFLVCDSSSGKYFPSKLEVHHFKWRGSILDKLRCRIEWYKKYGSDRGGADKRTIRRYRNRGTFQ
jgi:hypothetical protein